MARRITDEKVFLVRVRGMLPKGIPAEAVKDVECDPTDGENGGPSYWVYLANGYISPGTDSHIIHEDTLADIKREMKQVEVWANDPALKKIIKFPS